MYLSMFTACMHSSKINHPFAIKISKFERQSRPLFVWVFRSSDSLPNSLTHCVTYSFFEGISVYLRFCHLEFDMEVISYG